MSNFPTELPNLCCRLLVEGAAKGVVCNGAAAGVFRAVDLPLANALAEKSENGISAPNKRLYLCVQTIQRHMRCLGTPINVPEEENTRLQLPSTCAWLAWPINNECHARFGSIT